MCAHHPETSGAVNKQVLYVETLPSSHIQLMDYDQNIEDPLNVSQENCKNCEFNNQNCDEQVGDVEIKTPIHRLNSEDIENKSSCNHQWKPSETGSGDLIKDFITEGPFSAPHSSYDSPSDVDAVTCETTDGLDDGCNWKKIKNEDASVLFVCKIINCKFATSKQNELTKHKKQVHADARRRCRDTVVPYTGTTVSDLRKHVGQHQQLTTLPYVCPMEGCGFRARHSNSLIYHTKKYHPRGEPLRCAETSCNFMSHLAGSMRIHCLIKHGSGKSFCCELCTYKCYFMGDLRKHQRTHSGVSPYKCPSCPYTCKISSNLTKHYRTHTMEQPFHCEHCQFRTNFINSLKVHRRTHSNEKPYSCSHCEYRCNHASNLKKHIYRLHPGSIYTTLSTAKRRAAKFDTNAP